MKELPSVVQELLGCVPKAEDWIPVNPSGVPMQPMQPMQLMQRHLGARKYVLLLCCRVLHISPSCAGVVVSPHSSNSPSRHANLALCTFQPACFTDTLTHPINLTLAGPPIEFLLHVLVHWASLSHPGAHKKMDQPFTLCHPPRFLTFTIAPPTHSQAGSRNRPFSL